MEFKFGKRIATILTIKGKGNFVALNSVKKGDSVQISTSNGEEDAPLTSMGTFEVKDEKMFVSEINHLAAQEGIGLVLISIQ